MAKKVPKIASLEREIAKLERNQHGLTSVAQLIDAGLSASAAKRRVRRARHARIRRGVLVSPSVPPTFEQRLLAAVLAGGDGAFASHEAAARLWELPVPGAVPLEITTDLDRRPQLKGVRMHRSGLLIPSDVCEVNGILCSIVDRTIVDMSARFDLATLGRIVDNALRRKLTTIAQLEETSMRLKSAPGRSRRKMRTILSRRDEAVGDHESVLEDFVFDALRRFGLPLPVAQHRVVVDGQNRRIDFCYVEQSIALEPKGFEHHAPRASFDDDAFRGNELVLAGFKVFEFTSAFSDWKIADQVARALGMPRPKRPKRPLTFLEWKARRDRLERAVRYGGLNAPNGGVR